MHFPLSAHPTSMAPMPSLCSGSNLCTPSTHFFAGAALNTTASFTVSGATLKCSPVFYSQPPFPSLYFSLSYRITGFWSDDGFTKDQSIFTCSVIVQHALHGQDRITSNIIVSDYLLALKGFCWCQKWLDFVHFDGNSLSPDSPALAP